MQIFGRPRITGRCVGLCDTRVDDHRNRHREVRQRELGLADEIDLEGLLVDDDKLLRLFERPGFHLNGGKAAERDGTIQRPFHVCGGDGRPSQKTASSRSLKMIDMPSSLVVQLSARSGFSVA
jgi:hypothetical protein